MKYALLLLFLTGCATPVVQEPHMYDCQLLPYAVSLKLERYDMAAAMKDSQTVATKLNLKNVDIACREEP